MGCETVPISMCSNSTLSTHESELAEGVWSGRENLNLRHPAPKAGALPGCATPRLEYLEFHLSQQAFGLGERFGTMADRVFLIRRQLSQGLP